jgi:hypothetical protein
VDPWDGVLDASQDAPHCIQRGLFSIDGELIGQEDCLYLNVYTPRVRHFQEWSCISLHCSVGFQYNCIKMGHKLREMTELLEFRDFIHRPDFNSYKKKKKNKHKHKLPVTEVSSF